MDLAGIETVEAQVMFTIPAKNCGFARVGNEPRGTYFNLARGRDLVSALGNGYRFGRQGVSSLPQANQILLVRRFPNKRGWCAELWGVLPEGEAQPRPGTHAFLQHLPMRSNS